MKPILLLGIVLLVSACENELPVAGSWTRGCARNNDLQSEKSVYTFSNSGQLTVAASLYDGPSCGARVNVAVSSYSFTLAGPAAQPAGAQELNLTQIAEKVTPFTDMFTASWNAISFCGRNDYVTDRESDITGRGCFTAGTKIYTVYALDGASLYLGGLVVSGSGPGADESQRFDTLNRDLPLLRQ